jgi:hypothetical protein
MALDGIGNSYNMASARLPQQPSLMARVNRLDSAVDQGMLSQGLGSASANIASFNQNVVQPALSEELRDKSLRWASQMFVENKLNLTVAAASQHSTQKLREIGSTTDELLHSPARAGYTKALRLGNETVSLKSALSEKGKLAKVIRRNTFEWPVKLLSLFQEMDYKALFRERMEDNFKPIKDLLTNSPDKQLGSGLARVFGFGLMAYDICKNAKETFLKSRQNGDGLLSATGKTLANIAKSTLQDMTSWEAGSLGFVIGRTLLPITLFSVPIVGVLVGVVAGTVTHQCIERLFSDKKQKSHVPEASAQNSPEFANTNPFKQAV